MIENKLNEEKRDDSKDIITIDYYDRINKRWIKLDVTKEVARLLKAEDQRTRRAKNKYNYYNLPFDEVFDSDKNEELLIDENANFDFEEEGILRDCADEQRRTLIENSLDSLTPEQREVVEMAYFQNMSYSQIANARGLKSKNSVYKVMKAAEKNIKKYIEETQN